MKVLRYKINYSIYISIPNSFSQKYYNKTRKSNMSPLQNEVFKNMRTLLKSYTIDNMCVKISEITG